MSTADATFRDDGTVKDRLIRAADAEIAACGLSAVQMTAVAKSAGVSRATAFRQLGSVSEMFVEVALLRARRHSAAAKSLMAAKTGVFAKLEAALAYTTRELANDPSIFALIAQHSESVRHALVHQAAVSVFAPVLEEGRRSRQVRTDVDLDELVDFLVEQINVASDAIDRSEYEVRRRFRHFVIPGLAGPCGTGGAHAYRTMDELDAVGAAIDALETLSDRLRRGSSN